MIRTLRKELAAFWTAVRSLDRQAAWVLTLAAVSAVAQYKYGSRKFFRTDVADLLDADPDGLPQFLYHFVTQGLTGFIVPALVLLLVFRRKPSECGLGLGDWKLAGTIAVIYMPVVALACWGLSSMQSFQDQYPKLDEVAQHWQVFALYEVMFLLYWFGWEYLWRGFTLFGTRHVLGYWAIFVKMLPFAVLHCTKPAPEAFLSIFGGLVLGAVVWRVRAFWIAVPIHAFQMMMIDFMCTLRHRSGVTDGIGPGALLDVLRNL
jgi:hypothetical protein